MNSAFDENYNFVVRFFQFEVVGSNNWYDFKLFEPQDVIWAPRWLQMEKNWTTKL
jgi:hypothetical protein